VIEGKKKLSEIIISGPGNLKNPAGFVRDSGTDQIDIRPEIRDIQ
jgi:hypothetical protein